MERTDAASPVAGAAGYATHVGNRETVLLLSFAQRDALADQLAQQGFRVVAARRSTHIVRRFRALDAKLVVLDARNALSPALDAAQLLAPAVAAANASMLLLYDRNDAERIIEFAAHGITAMLPAPWHAGELTLAIALARRNTAVDARRHAPVRQLWWNADLTDGALHFDGGPSDLTHMLLGDDSGGSAPNLRQFLRRCASEDARRAWAAYHKLRRYGGHAAFAQAVTIDERQTQAIHHLSISGMRMAGHVEILPGGAVGDTAVAASAAPEWMDFDEALGLLRAKTTGGATRPGGTVDVAMLRVDLAGDGAADHGSAAMMKDVAEQIMRALRQRDGSGAVAASINPALVTLIFHAGSDPHRAQAEFRALAGAVAFARLTRTGGNAVLRLAQSTATADVAAQAVLARLSAAIDRPEACVTPIDLSAALSTGEIDVGFQPQFDITSDALVGAEALARWRHPQLGPLSGSALFAAASASNMEREVSIAVWNRALGAMAAWPAAMHRLTVAINVTAADLADRDAAKHLLGLARQHGVSPRRIAVEVTEGTAIADLDKAAATLTALRAAGVRVALDDFGSGFSGMAWLKQLPVDYIKIDAGFARDAAGSARERAVLQGVIDYARNQSIAVLAEGVEHAQQREQLRSMGCRWYQGFLRAPALDDADFRQFASTAGQSVGDLRQPL